MEHKEGDGMTRRKQLIWTLIPLGAILLMGAVVLLLCQQVTPAPAQEVQPMYLEDVSQYNQGEEPVFVVRNGPRQRAQAPLARYSITPPEGYAHTTDAASTANRASERYTDRFLGQGRKVTFTQQAVANQDQVVLPVPASPQQVECGGLELICYTTDSQSGAYWLYGNSLLQLSVTGRMEPDQLAEWIRRVDLTSPVYPASTPLTFLPGYRQEVTGEDGLITDAGGWQVAGNPEPAANPRSFHLSQVPQGFSPSEGGVVPDRWEYQNDRGDRLLLRNLRVTEYTNSNIFSKMPEEDYNNPDLVAQVTVGGREGRLYCTPDYAELVVLGEDVAGQLIYQGTTTPQAMLELGESLILE